METKYKTPKCTRCELVTEGYLCESNIVGAGMLQDNSWASIFGENNSAGAGSFDDNSW